MNFFFFLFLTLFLSNFSFQSGEKLFLQNCAACHPTGKNLIIPEKNLKKNTLETNGMNSQPAIVYQVRNGKNGMPAFGDRLEKKEIERIADYILLESEKNFEN
jgi:cytochrome c6